MDKQTKITFDERYEFYGGLGSWFQSKERIILGTTRYVREMLFYATYYHKPYTTWTPVEQDKNTMEELRVFKGRL